MTTLMQALHPEFSIEAFFARLRTAHERVLMLDYDGTLAPFCIDPAEAVPYPGVIALLDAIGVAGRTRLVIVSGRWIRDLLPLLGLKRVPELWGSHGWERRRADGDYDIGRIRPGALELLLAVDDWTAEIAALGARAERKPASIAFHWRGLSDDRIAAIRARLSEKWAALAQVDEIAWHDFDGGIELRAAGRGKGDVVRAIAAEAGAGAALAYLGDDQTDEDAFEAMPDHGVAALVRPQFRPTAADLWIRPPGELLGFLARWHETSGGAR
jgi:trehalose-phosphatase